MCTVPCMCACTCLHLTGRRSCLTDVQSSATATIRRQRAEGAIVAAQSAHGYAAKRAAVGAAVGKSAAGAAGADEAAARSRAEAAALTEDPAWGDLIAAVPGPLGEERQRQRDAAAGLLGYGLPARDRQSLQAESAAQDAYLEQVDTAMDALKAMGLVRGLVGVSVGWWDGAGLGCDGWGVGVLHGCCCQRISSTAHAFQTLQYVALLHLPCTDACHSV